MKIREIATYVEEMVKVIDLMEKKGVEPYYLESLFSLERRRFCVGHNRRQQRKARKIEESGLKEEVIEYGNMERS